MRIFLIISLLFLIATACSSDSTKKIDPDSIKPQDPEAYQKFSGNGGCFQMATSDWTEVINLNINDKEVTGTGRRMERTNSQAFLLDIKGKTTGKNTLEVVVKARSQKGGSGAETSYENWKIVDNRLEINNRNFSNFVGNFTALKVNCNAAQRDTSQFDAFMGFFEGYAVVAKNGLFGLVNKDMEMVIPAEYVDLSDVSEGTLTYYNPDLGRHGVMDVEGNIIVEPKYDEITNFKDGVAAYLDNGKWGFLGRDGQPVIEPSFIALSFNKQTGIHPFSEGLANVAIDQMKWGYINPEGKAVIDYQYMFAGPFKKGKAKVTKDGKAWFYINKNGTCVEDCPE